MLYFKNYLEKWTLGKVLVVSTYTFKTYWKKCIMWLHTLRHTWRKVVRAYKGWRKVVRYYISWNYIKEGTTWLYTLNGIWRKSVRDYISWNVPEGRYYIIVYFETYLKEGSTWLYKLKRTWRKVVRDYIRWNVSSEHHLKPGEGKISKISKHNYFVCLIQR